jgi:signal transduction histidine kinase
VPSMSHRREGVEATDGGSVLLRVEQVLSSRSPGFVVVVGLLLLALISLVDVVTGAVLALPEFFYLVPIAVVTFARGRKTGALMAAASAAAFGATEIANHTVRFNSGVMYTNFFTRFLIFEAVSLMIAPMRSALLRQRGLGQREAEAAERLRALNGLKDTLLHAVSHDLKGPMAAIRGSVSVLERADQLHLTQEQRQEMMMQIAVSARKADNLVSDLLDLERLDRGVLDPDREPTDVLALVEHTAELNERVRDRDLDVRGDHVLVSVDRVKVERIIDNLLTNAAKYTPPDSPIVIRLEARDDGVLLCVEDRGPGIPDEMKDVIFEPFRQGEGSTGKGVGIGLSLVRKFAELHGGRAWAEDQPGGGTIFKTLLPGELSRSPDGVRASAVGE